MVRGSLERSEVVKYIAGEWVTVKGAEELGPLRVSGHLPGYKEILILEDGSGKQLSTAYSEGLLLPAKMNCNGKPLAAWANCDCRLCVPLR